jgi:hypothetical protein
VAVLIAVLLAAVAAGGYATWARRNAAHNGSPGPSGGPAPGSGSSTGAAVPATFPANATGAWAGRLSQNNDRSWRVEVTLAPGTGQSTVTYPELGCKGTLTLIDRAGAAMQVREHITTGKCSPAGTITLTRSGADEFLFVYVPDGRKYTATGTLTRK